MKPQEVVMLVGCPASGKGSFLKSAAHFDDHVVLNRDTEGGKVESLVPKMIMAISQGKSVVLDNTFPTAESRKPFIDAANIRKVPITCLVMGTTIEEAQVNALNRMWDRYGTIFLTAVEIKAHARASKDPNMFPIAALFHYRKQFEAPKQAEGFACKPETIPFVRKPATGKGKAVILDYDDTLRRSKGERQYPVRCSDIEILPGRKEVLQRYKKKGFLLLGASNQSGVAKGELTLSDADELFRHTNKLLGLDVHYLFCPHSPAPITCYCRKPQSGLAVYFIRKYDLDPSQCIFVGDSTTDKSWAARVGFQYQTPSEFFGGQS